MSSRVGTEVSASSRTFHLTTPSGASLDGTIVPPREPRFTEGSSGVQFEGEQFFVVMTVQQGGAPAVTVEGDGFNARVRVGAQVVSIAGDRGVLGTFGGGDGGVLPPLDAGVAIDASVAPRDASAPDASAPDATPSDAASTGCGCRTTGSPSRRASLALLALAAVVATRRRTLRRTCSRTLR